MSDIGFFADIRYSDIVQLLLSDSDINQYRYAVVELTTWTPYGHPESLRAQY